MRGAPGRPGVKGPTGPPGANGKRGRPGDLGSRGLPGDIGEYGQNGRDGPPVIQVKEITVPVPHIIVKEVTVPIIIGPPDAEKGLTPWPPPKIITARPPLITTSMITKDHTETSGMSHASDKTLLVPTEKMTSTGAPKPTTTTMTLYTGPPTLGTNRRRCMLDAVGIPVLHAKTQFRSRVGSWMRDARPVNSERDKHRWVTDSYASEVLYEYKNERDLLNKKQLIKYYVDYLASGTGGIIYNGSYFYHRHNSEYIVRYDLNTTNQTQRLIPNLAHRDCDRKMDENQMFERCRETERDPWLYNIPHNYVDFAVDENGIWVLYQYPTSPSLVVSKLNFWDLHIVATWNITEENITDLQNTFIMCGVLYGLENSTERNTKISFAFDLFEDRSKFANVTWYNPYRKNTMLDYNPFDQRIYFYDEGHLLSVNVRTRRKESHQNGTALDFDSLLD